MDDILFFGGSSMVQLTQCHAQKGYRNKDTKVI